MTIQKVIAAAAVACLPGFAQAAIVDAGQYVPNATGSTVFGATFNAPSTQFFDVQAAGTLADFSIWIDLGSNIFNTTESFAFSLLGKPAAPGFPDLTDTLAAESFSNASVAAGPQVTGSTGGQFVELTWDLSAFNISATLGEQFGVRLGSGGPSGQILVAGNSCNFTSPTCPVPTELNISRFSGTSTTVGNTGSPINVWGYSLTVDDGTVVVDPGDNGGPAPVPLPAALPLLLAGLGLLGALRRRG